MRVLNLYAGVGGNRKLWTDCQVTAVEIDPTIAHVYNLLFPDDEVIAGDAHAYLENHYSEFDFIWSSSPYPSHGQYRHNVGVIGKGFKPLLPDMKLLYLEIIFLSTYFKGSYIVENVKPCYNVKPYYDVLIEPAFELQRHLFWSNKSIERRQFKASGIGSKNKIKDFEGFEIVSNSNIPNKRQVLRNCVDPEVGKYIFDSMF